MMLASRDELSLLDWKEAMAHAANPSIPHASSSNAHLLTSSMHRGAVLLVLLALLGPISALTEGEVEALSSILSSWPALGNLPPGQRPWQSNNISRACQDLFYGVGCSSGPDPHVKSLIISSLLHGGTIPDAIGMLPFLEMIHLHQTGLSGTIPNALFNSSVLTSVSLRGNELTGTIPASLYRANALLQLVIAENELSGEIREEIGQLPNLRGLHLVCPFLTGRFPRSIWRMSLLSELELVFAAHLTGSITSDISEMTELRQLSLIGLQSMSGTLPPEIGKLKNLVSLTLSGSGFTGGIEVLGSLSNLRSLGLAGSDFSGTIPSSIANNTGLHFLSLSGTRLEGPIPREFGRLKVLSALAVQNLRSRGLGQLPAEIGEMFGMSHLNLDNSGLTGTIPPEIVKLTALTEMTAKDNRLEGTIPRFRPLTPEVGLSLDLSNNILSGNLEDLASSSPLTRSSPGKLRLNSNKLTGTIPIGIFSAFTDTIDLSSNQLSGQLPEDAFAFAFTPIPTFKTISSIILNDNNLSGTIPSRGLEESELAELYLQRNSLTGTIPSAFAHAVHLQKIYLSYNQLTGNLEGWSRSSRLPSGQKFLVASFNRLSGQLPFINHHGLYGLDLSYNNLSGTIPMLPPNLLTLDLSFNSLTEGLEMVAMQNNMIPVIVSINLSHNNIRGRIPSTILHMGALTTLNLAHNTLSGQIPLGKDAVLSLSSLDLSHNNLTGNFPEATFTYLTALKLNDNQFTGVSFGINSPRLSYLDISGNRFGFNAAEFTRFPDLVSLIASNNFIYGNLGGFKDMPSLRVVDLSRNKLTGTLPLNVLHQMYSRNLQQLFITNNRNMTTIATLKEEGPWRTLQSQPSSIYPGFVNCFTLTFSPNSTTTQFLFDENLFDWSQCDCMQGYYGIPPLSCFTCPSSSSCQARHINVPENRFLYPVTNNMDGDDNKKEISTVSLVRHRLPFQSESCLVSISAHQSNCIGIGVDINDASSSYMMSMVPGWNKRQCKEGSEGRLCSRCQCGNSPLTTPPDTSTGIHESNSISLASSSSALPSCFFMRGVRCSRCYKVFRPSQSIGMIGGLLLLLIMIITIVMYLVLRSRRQRRDLKWENLPRWRRIFNRLVDASSFGLVSLAIMFVQLLSEVTHWQEYALQSFVKLLNGDSESIGLVCLFPTILSQPLASLALRLALPLIVIMIIGISICLAQLGHRLVDLKSKRHFNRFDTSSNRLLESNDSSISIYDDDDDDIVDGEILIDYPAMALFTSTTISALQFFYFGTALAATEYFFASVQSGTGVAYVQAHPWLLYHDSAPMRHLSIPWLVVIVFGLPFVFIMTCIKFRHKINSPLILSYTGSLFRKFSTRCYWWEIINVTKKLTIALLIRGIPASNPFQPALIILTIAATQLLQILLTPWRRRLENVMDPVGGTLLISSLFAASVNSDLNGVTFMIMTIDGVYVVSLVVMICYHAITEETEYERVWKAAKKSPSSGINLKEVDEPLLRHPIVNMMFSSDSTDESYLEAPADSEIDD